MRILFVGESWLGSCARSLREAIVRQTDVLVEEVSDSDWFRSPRGVGLRVANRLTRPAYLSEFEARILQAVREFRPDVFMTYKGYHVRTHLLEEIKSCGIPTVNVYPDCSPWAHGKAHRTAVGHYDLVISTKPFHPAIWRTTYGYENDCVFIPQGYDPILHCRRPADRHQYDVSIVATWRSSYGQLMYDVGKRLGDSVTVVVGGHGWAVEGNRLPPHWSFPGSVHGQSYVDCLQSGRIAIAPVTTSIAVDGIAHPGDVDTTRTYELPAASCFFVHQRTTRVVSLFDEAREVPMFDTAEELVAHIQYFLKNADARRHMAECARARAVPRDSLDHRAAEVLTQLRELCS